MDEHVQFEENLDIRPYEANRFGAGRQKLGNMTIIFIKVGLAKDEKQASVSMLVVSAICLILMTYFIMSTYFPNALNFNKQKPVVPMTTEQILDGIRNGTIKPTE